MSKNIIKLVPFLILLTLGQTAAYADNATANSLSTAEQVNSQSTQDILSPYLGAGYSSDDLMPVSTCLLKGEMEKVGNSFEIVDSDKKINLEKVKNELNIITNNGYNGTLFFGLSASNEFDLYKTMLQTDGSISYVFSTNIRFQNERWIEPENDKGDIPLNGRGLRAEKDGNFRQQCGDKYIVQLGKTAKVFIAVRFSFANHSDELKFDEKVKLGGEESLVSLDNKLKVEKNLKQYNGSMHISGFQEGGQPGALSAILKDTTDGSALECSFDDISKCELALNAIGEYFTTLKDQFPEEKPINAVASSIVTADFPRSLVRPDTSQLTPEITEMRKKLGVALEKTYAQQQRLDYLAKISGNAWLYKKYNLKINGVKGAKEGIKEQLEKNIDILKNTGQACFTDSTLEQCTVDAKEALDKKMVPIADADIELPTSFYVTETVNGQETKQTWVVDNLKGNSKIEGSYHGKFTDKDSTDKTDYSLFVTNIRSSVEIEKQMVNAKYDNVKVAIYRGENTLTRPDGSKEYEGTVDYYDPTNPDSVVKTGTWTANFVSPKNN